LAWQGNPRHQNDRNRSISTSFLEPLLGLSGLALYSLQLGPAAAWDPRLGKLTSLTGQIRDYADTARFLEQLDLVITVDTSIAHLAGALARPAWVLLPFAPDWRWLLGRNDSPWYPTVRLFRQPAPGDWPSVIEEVVSTLTRMEQTLPTAMGVVFRT
jgi:hypothetical protein